ncbi:B-cell receptor CD22-like [Paramisgurnus dabryanus]|uniref:B-cell receptor CD22-like n=1 Tax=Paramisgurnus dabryanus TaxID=90735 RepID=UPI003CCF9C87
MVMSTMLAPPPLIFLLMIHEVYSADDGWGVHYSSSSICALKGSTVIINCTYKYPTGHQINNTFWTKINSADPPDLSEDSEYSQRIQYLGDKHHNCTMSLTDVRQTDSHKYYFRFITDKNKWLGVPGVTLDITLITDLQVQSSGERVTEGHSVTLTCKSSCSLTDGSTFIWYKNNQSLSERTDRNNQLILQSVRRNDSGNYSCAVQGHNLTSPHQYLNVISPDKPEISVNSSGEIMEGDSVTLTCKSKSNPPAQNYTWFKVNETSSVGSGQTYSITNINSRHSGWFYCEVQNKDRSQKSVAVLVNVKGKMMIFHLIIGLLILGAVVFIVVLIIWRIRWMKKRNSFQTVHHSPSHDSHKTCDLYENLRTADDSSPVYGNIKTDSYDESNLSSPVYENI